MLPAKSALEIEEEYISDFLAYWDTAKVLREQDNIQESIKKIVQENPNILQVGKSKIGLTLQKLVNKCAKYPKLEGLLAYAQSVVQNMKAKIITELFGSIEENSNSTKRCEKSPAKEEVKILDTPPEAKAENNNQQDTSDAIKISDKEANNKNEAVHNQCEVDPKNIEKSPVELTSAETKSCELPAKICEELAKHLVEVLFHLKHIATSNNRNQEW